MAAANGGRKEPVIDNRPLLEQLSSTVGLSLLAGVEVYAPANQQTAPGDGKRYDFAAIHAGKRVKRIKASFRYAASTPTLGNFILVVAEPNTTAYIAWGLYDEWNAQAGFRLVSDIHNRTLRTTNWNDVLEVTFAEPVAIEDMYLKIGGRAGFSYAPVYMKDFEIEFA